MLYESTKINPLTQCNQVLLTPQNLPYLVRTSLRTHCCKQAPSSAPTNVGHSSRLHFLKRTRPLPPVNRHEDAWKWREVWYMIWWNEKYYHPLTRLHFKPNIYSITTMTSMSLDQMPILEYYTHKYSNVRSWSWYYYTFIAYLKPFDNLVCT
jgi:hypothetical protein